ncbi:MAG: MopE-related protein [Myxococcota bacterium]
MDRSLRLALLLPALTLFSCTDGDTDTGTDTGGDTGTDEGPVDVDNDGFSVDEDCDDSNPEINPDATEVCDEVDNNCNDEIDEGVTQTFYVDADADGEGDANAAVEACEAADGQVTNSTDCDDTDALINTADADADGLTSCDGDCDDTSDTVLPGAPEIPGNAIDEDCDSGDLPLEGVLLLNEVHYDPSNQDLDEDGMDDGDANGDGDRSSIDDEFVEFINMASVPIDISGFRMWDEENLTDPESTTYLEINHEVPAGTIIQPGKALVVFGGTAPTGDFGGATVQVSTLRELNLNNNGDRFIMQDSNGVEFFRFDIEPLSSNPNQSYTRNPDITGAFELHTDNTPLLYSPGTTMDGSNF